MSDAQTKTDRLVRLGEAYLDAEGHLHDLKNMAGIAESLFDDTGIKNEKGDVLTIQMNKWEFERLQFAIYRTSHMASDLLDAFDEAAEHALEVASAA
jgi:hypothetical protein